MCGVECTEKILMGGREVWEENKGIYSGLQLSPDQMSRENT